MGCVFGKCMKTRRMMEEPELQRKSKRQRLNNEVLGPSVSDVLENYDLLREVLLRVGEKDGIGLRERQILGQVSKLWREVSKSVPVRIAFDKPMSLDQELSLRDGIPGLCHLEFAGHSEQHVPTILDSEKFIEACGASLTTLCNVPLKKIPPLHSFPNLSKVEFCRCERTNVLDFIHGMWYDLTPLAGLTKLETLVLNGMGNRMASILNLDQLPPSLKHLELRETALVHHPELKLPTDLCLDTLRVFAGKDNSAVVPLQLISRTKKTYIEGPDVQLVGTPTVSPDMEEEMLEVLVERGMMLLISFSVERTQHETCLSSVIDELLAGPFQSLDISFVPVGGVLQLVGKSDCRKGMRWKSVEAAEDSDFICDTIELFKEQDLGASASTQVVDGELHSYKLCRN